MALNKLTDAGIKSAEKKAKDPSSSVRDRPAVKIIAHLAPSHTLKKTA
jgi:hypothetical protein